MKSNCSDSEKDFDIVSSRHARKELRESPSGLTGISDNTNEK